MIMTGWITKYNATFAKQNRFVNDFSVRTCLFRVAVLSYYGHFLASSCFMLLCEIAH